MPALRDGQTSRWYLPASHCQYPEYSLGTAPIQCRLMRRQMSTRVTFFQSCYWMHGSRCSFAPSSGSIYALDNLFLKILKFRDITSQKARKSPKMHFVVKQLVLSRLNGTILDDLYAMRVKQLHHFKFVRTLEINKIAKGINT